MRVRHDRLAVGAGMMPFIADHFGNPSERGIGLPRRFSRPPSAKAPALKKATREIAAMIGGENDEVVFIAGLAARGQTICAQGVTCKARYCDHSSPRGVENPAIIVEPCRVLERWVRG